MKRRHKWRNEVTGSSEYIDEFSDKRLIGAWQWYDAKLKAAPEGESHPNWETWRDRILAAEIQRRGLDVPGLDTSKVVEKPPVSLHGGKTLRKLQNAKLKFRRE